MAKQRILITVKTYPTLSTTYGELVCTAGITEEGKWIRIYPVPFRRLEHHQKYKKFHFIEADIQKSTTDSRPDSYKIDVDTLSISDEKLDTSDGWRERRNFILKKTKVYTNLSELIHLAQQSKELSLATFKPTEIIDFKVEPSDADWDEKKVSAIKALQDQGDLFEDWNDPKNFDLVEKIPWKFSYRFKDDEGRESTLMIEDWETGQLYRNVCKTKTPEKAAEDVKIKYLKFAKETDVHFFLGTTKQHHYTARNPFIIIGCFPIPFDHQPQFEF
jgi:hypothetical protein